MFMFT